MKKIGLLCLTILALALGGCGDSARFHKSSTSGGTSKKVGGTMNNDMFVFTIDSLNRLEQFQTEAVQGEIKLQLIELEKKAAAKPSASPESTLLAAWPASDSMRQIVDRLNQWIRTQPPPDWRLDPMLAGLPETLRNLPVVSGVDKMEITPFDGYYLQEAVYLRDVSLAARGKSIEDLSRASRLFDWTVRNLQLDADTPQHFPQFPWESLFFGHGTAAERAWVFVLLARQQGLDAAVLAIDKKTDEKKAEDDKTSTSSRPLGEGPGVRAWCVAVRIEGKAYLFDPQWGLPIPGPGGLRKGEAGQLDIIPATLDQLLADQSLLERMNADAEHPYAVTPADLKSVVALVEASPTALSRRMKAIESRLQGNQKMVLTASATEQAEHWKSVPGISAVKLWQLPYETIRRRSELKPAQIAQQLASFLPFYAMPAALLHGEAAVQKAGLTPKDMRDPYKGTAADNSGKKSQSPADMVQDTESQKLRRQVATWNQFSTTFTAPLYKGRVLQLKGQVSGEISAMKYYQMSRPSQEEMQIIQRKLFAEIVAANLAEKNNFAPEEKEKLVPEIVETILTEKRIDNPEAEKVALDIKQNYTPFIEEQLALTVLGKMDASYWLGLVTYERANYQSAIYYFADGTLNAWPDGQWTAGAKYNLGRTLEAGGGINEAVKFYRSNADAPDAAGQLLRAKWLGELKEKKEEPQE